MKCCHESIVAVVSVAAVLLLDQQYAVGHGSLAEMKSSVRTPSAPSKERRKPQGKERRRCDHSYNCSCEDDDSWSLKDVGAMFYAATSPLWGPIVLTKDSYASPGYFPEYPYQHDIDGYMMIDPWVPSEPFTYAFHVRTEYADDFDSISRIGTHLRFDTTKRFGFDSEVNYWREAFANQQHDDLWTGDANAVLRFAQADWMQMRTGIGLNWLADDVETNLGFNFTYGGDFFPADPWVISAEIDLGSLGDETLVHGRLTTGLQWHRAEVYVGYDYYKVDRTELTGFVSGLRLWF